MGRSIKVRYVFRPFPEASGVHMTSQEWRTRARYGMPTHGKPSAEAIRRYVGIINGSCEPGGANAHLGARGRIAGGEIYDQQRGIVVARWEDEARAFLRDHFVFVEVP